MVGGPNDAPFEREAAKRTALLRLVEDMGAEWGLFLDADERIETDLSADDLSDRILSWTEADFVSALWWLMVDIYQSSPASPAWKVPRMIRIAPCHDRAPRPLLEFRPPRDFDLYRDGERIAYLDGEPVPAELSGRYGSLSPDVLRIRHDRHLRTPERIDMSAAYVVRRRREHGVA